LLNKDQHLLDDHIDTILDLPDAQLQAWINQFRVAVLERNRIFIPDQTQTSAALCKWIQGCNERWALPGIEKFLH